MGAISPLIPMKKLSLLVGTLGGAFAGYLFSNKKLRDELSGAKDAEQAAKTLGKHLQKDGGKFAKQVREFVESDEVQDNLGKAKDFAKVKFDEAKKELGQLVQKGKTNAEKQLSRTTKKAVKTVKKAVSGRKPARMKTKTRTVA
jgi:F0F1-type ATP synthase membrane subunit b/b'